MNPVLVTGARGQLGTELVRTIWAAGAVVVGPGLDELDVSDRDHVMQCFGSVRPSVVLHAAAWADVDGCERDRDRAMRVNALGTRHVAEAARAIGAHLCYVSTDYVFSGVAPDGGTPEPYDEWEATDPRCVYGRSKLAGERVLGPDATVVRTSWLCGAGGANFVKTVIDRAERGEKLTVVDDQHGSPTFAADLAPMIWRLASARLPGVFHVTNQGSTTWFGLARETLVAASLDPDLVSPITTQELRPPRPARRPPYSVLDNAALRLSGLPALAHYSESLQRLVKELRP